MVVPLFLLRMGNPSRQYCAPLARSGNWLYSACYRRCSACRLSGAGVGCADSFILLSFYPGETVNGRLARSRAIHGNLPLRAHFSGPPAEGDCKVAIAMRIDKGEKDGVKLDGLSFVLLLHAPKAMAEGNITVGLIVDERASDKQAEAIGAIATGAAGGPMAALGPLVGKVAGVEKRPIRFEIDGMKISVKAGDLIDQSLEGVPGPARPGEPIYLRNTCHPGARGQIGRAPVS